MRVLPENLRKELKKPIGKVLNEDELIDLLKKEKFIVSIGDIVTYTILKHNIEPSFCIVDYNTRRGKCDNKIVKKIKSYGDKEFLIKNPPGTITDELWDAINYAFKSIENFSIRIEVIGEEDLSSLAVIHMAPPNVTIIYGLPDKGVLVIKSTPENKKLVKEVLEKM